MGRRFRPSRSTVTWERKGGSSQILLRQRLPPADGKSSWGTLPLSTPRVFVMDSSQVFTPLLSDITAHAYPFSTSPIQGNGSRLCLHRGRGTAGEDERRRTVAPERIPRHERHEHVPPQTLGVAPPGVGSPPAVPLLLGPHPPGRRRHHRGWRLQSSSAPSPRTPQGPPFPSPSFSRAPPRPSPRSATLSCPAGALLLGAPTTMHTPPSENC